MFKRLIAHIQVFIKIFKLIFENSGIGLLKIVLIVKPLCIYIIKMAMFYYVLFCLF
jgi:hypothetical protein